ncbi:WXG100 family type VII secretion target, partial [Arthrobacter globiformis]|uniref:WXG100 family type VII secretion target n=1 Tax=Arthrobacter globiformis TaxID=1665 RepID=UPI003F5972D7
LGADVEALRNLGTRLNNGSTEIQNQKNQLNNALRGVEWNGQDANQFRNQWETEHLPALDRVARALEEAGKQASRNAQQQEEASRG